MSSEELGFGTDPNSPGDGGGPRRRDRPRTAVLVVGAVTAVLVGLGLGALIASWRGGTPDASPTGASASSTLPSASATSVSPTAPRTTAPSKSPARTVTKSPTATHIPAPTGFVDAPWTTSGSDFGFLRSAGLLSGGQVRVTFDRAQWLTGKAYDDYVKAHGAPDNDYVIVNTSKRLRTFVLPKGAPLSGSAILVGGRPRTRR